MSGCFDNSAYDKYLERLVDEHNSEPDDEEDNPNDEYYPEEEDLK